MICGKRQRPHFLSQDSSFHICGRKPGHKGQHRCKRSTGTVGFTGKLRICNHTWDTPAKSKR